MEHAICIAVSVDEAEKQERFNNSFYTRNDSRTYSDSNILSHAAGTRKAGQPAGRRTQAPQNANRARDANTRDAQTNAALRCYECEGVGHYASECPTRIRREQGSCQQPGRKNPTECSKRFGPSSENSPTPIKQDSRKESSSSGNGRRA